jgi:hypothetical protein
MENESFAERSPKLAAQIEASNIPRQNIIAAIRCLAERAGIGAVIEAILKPQE